MNMAQTHPIKNGTIMFVTTNLRDRRRDFANSACALIAAETLFSIQDFYPIFLYGFVIMPDHLHLLLRAPEHGSVSKFMGIYKRAVTFAIGRGPLWQQRFHLRSTVENASSVLRYIHLNPVKAGLCSAAENYPWSSASGRWDIAELD